MSNDSSRPSNTLAQLGTIVNNCCETDYCHKNAFYKLKSHSIHSVHVLTLTVTSHCERSCYGGLSIIIYHISIICVRCKVFLQKETHRKSCIVMLQAWGRVSGLRAGESGHGWRMVPHMYMELTPVHLLEKEGAVDIFVTKVSFCC